MTGSAVKYWLILACALATMYGSFIVWRRENPRPSAVAHARVAPPERGQPPLEAFVLTDQAGRQFDSASLRGKVWVGSFFFTNCPAVCWRLNQTLAALQETNPSSEARFVSITCDPANDTPAALARYAAHFKADPARWTFLTGDMNLIRRIGNDMFKVAVETETHSDRAFVVDRAGRVRGRFRLTQPDQVEMLKKLLATVEDERTVEAETAPKAQPAAESPAPDAASAPRVLPVPEPATDASGGA